MANPAPGFEKHPDHTITVQPYGRTVTVFFGDTVITTPSLTLPHPQIQNRNFVLVPLEEIAPDFIHPVLKKDVRTLRAICGDTLEVRREG